MSAKLKSKLPLTVSAPQGGADEDRDRLLALLSAARDVTQAESEKEASDAATRPAIERAPAELVKRRNEKAAYVAELEERLRKLDAVAVLAGERTAAVVAAKNDAAKTLADFLFETYEYQNVERRRT